MLYKVFKNNHSLEVEAASREEVLASSIQEYDTEVSIIPKPIEIYLSKHGRVYLQEASGHVSRCNHIEYIEVDREHGCYKITKGCSCSNTEPEITYHEYLQTCLRAIDRETKHWRGISGDASSLEVCNDDRV